MTGVDEGRLLAYLDGELGPEDRAELETWLEARPEARERLEAVRARRRAVTGLLAELPATAPDAEEVRDRVRLKVRAAVSGGHGTTTTRGWWSRRSRLAQAATILLLLAGGAAAAVVPGSPLRSLLGVDDAAPVETVAPDATAAPAEEVGVRVRPADGRLVVVLTGLPEDADVTAELVDDGQGAVFAPRGTRFRSGSGRIEASVEGPGGFGCSSRGRWPRRRSGSTAVCTSRSGASGWSSRDPRPASQGTGTASEDRDGASPRRCGPPSRRHRAPPPRRRGRPGGKRRR